MAMGTFAVQQVQNEVSPVQELVKLYEEILLAVQIESLKKALLYYRDVFAQHDSD